MVIRTAYNIVRIEPRSTKATRHIARSIVLFITKNHTVHRFNIRTRNIIQIENHEYIYQIIAVQRTLLNARHRHNERYAYIAELIEKYRL